MPLFSSIARKKKVSFFIDSIPKDARILEIGCGSNWLRDYFLNNGWGNYTSVDIEGAPSIKGDINSWRALGLKENEFDIIIAFEVVEHDDIWAACYSLLKQGGNLLITTPYPAGDWVLRIFEFLGLNQKRTSPHNHLENIKKVYRFETVYYKKILNLSQWAIFKK
jgi:2-polyprenyl-3-methyl-5-hydroxy-6-metoxy-1,4-benzoquinol methylase